MEYSLARISRTRTRSYTTIGVQRTIRKSTGISSEGQKSITRTSSITDRVGRPVTPSPLISTQYKGEIIASGEFDDATFRNILIAVPLSHNLGDVIDASDPAVPSGWELTTVARSNPSRPVVYPFEIVESVIQLPRMLKGLLNLLVHPRTIASPKGVANEYLGLQFGWLPFIDDFRKIANCQSYVSKKAKELQQLYSGKGLRRRVRFSNETRVYQQYARVAGANIARADFWCSTEVTREVWATVRWKPTAPLPFAGEHDARYGAYLRNLVLGFTPEGLATGAWKIIPWTWLIGWFTNVGDYLMVHSNTVPASYSQACLMRKVVVTRKPTAIQVTNATDRGLSHTGTHVSTRKLRTVGSGVLVPGFNMPFLDMFRLSVLGSLAIQRIRL